MIPAARCFQLLGLVTVLLLAAFLAPRLGFAAAALDLLVLAATALDAYRARRVPLAAVRRWPPMLSQGTAVEVAVEVAVGAAAVAAAGAGGAGEAGGGAGGGAAGGSDGGVGRSGGGGPAAGRRAVELELREGLHPALAAVPLRLRVTVAGPRPVLWRYTLVPRRRGDHRLAPLTVRVLGPWRLGWAQRDLAAGERVRVYPQMRWEGRVGQLLAAAHRRKLGQIAMPLSGMGSEPYALRPYLAGDPLSKVHWKATARHGQLVSREDTWERSARLVVLLDCARAMASMDGGRSKLDYALAAAIALTRVAAARGDQVSVVAFSNRIERRIRIHPGARSARLAYQSLYDLEAEVVEPAYDLVAEVASQLEARGSTVMLFTSVVDLVAAELLHDMLVRLAVRHRPVLVNLEDPELRRLATSAPATPAAAFAQVASFEISLANRRLATHLRRGGIRVVTSSADRLALTALEAYLALYRGRAAPALAASL